MKKMMRFFFILAIPLLSCSKTSVTEVPVIQITSDAIAKNILTLSDAEKILGEPVTLTENTFENKENLKVYKCAYTAKEKQPTEPRPGVIYFMLQDYQTESDAKKEYAAIKKSNENNEGFEVLKDLGDEAYFHTDTDNFSFILVRKGNKMLRLKVNKVTKLFSLENFYSVSKAMTTEM